jgi:hypothetical protein
MRELKDSDFGRIRFVDAPDGGAPIDVRRQWIGIEVPCLFLAEPTDGTDDTHYSTDIVTGERKAVGSSYIVYQIHAIEALLMVAPEAAEWFMTAGYPTGFDALFNFNMESAEPLTPIRTREEFMKSFMDA